MEDLTDESIMEWGAHKGKAMANVPARTLLWYYDNFRRWSESQLPVKQYIEDNMDVLRQQAEKE